MLVGVGVDILLWLFRVWLIHSVDLSFLKGKVILYLSLVNYPSRNFLARSNSLFMMDIADLVCDNHTNSVDNQADIDDIHS